MKIKFKETLSDMIVPLFIYVVYKLDGLPDNWNLEKCFDSFLLLCSFVLFLANRISRIQIKLESKND